MIIIIIIIIIIITTTTTTTTTIALTTTTKQYKFINNQKHNKTFFKLNDKKYNWIQIRINTRLT